MNAQQIVNELQSLDMQNPGAWPKWARIGFAVLAGLLVIAAGYWFFVRDKTDQLDRVVAQEAELRGEFERKQRKVAGLDAYKAQLEEMEQSFGAMLRQLPSRAEVANLINDISQTRIASGLDENLFQPQPEVMRDFYAEIPNRIELTGSYHELGSFVSGIAALPRIVTIEQVTLQPYAPDGRASRDAPLDGRTLQMTATAKTYRYLDAAEIEAAEQQAAPRGRR